MTIRRLSIASLSVLIALGSARAAHPMPGYVVRYRSQGTIYLDAGQSDGLEVGQKLQVVSGGEPVAELEVTYVADHSASTRVVSEKRPVRVGDRAEPIVADGLARAAASAPLSPTQAPGTQGTDGDGATGSQTPRPSQPWARVHGGVSLGYQRTFDTSSTGFDFEQRQARIDIQGSELGGQPISFSLRLSSNEAIRSQSFLNGVPKSEWNNRLYEAALRYESRNQRVAVQAGRITVGYFSGVGLFDGVSAALGVLRGIQIGGFYGHRADLFGLDFSGGGTTSGGFFRLTPRFGATWRGEALVAAIHDEAQGALSRDYASVESRLQAGTRLLLLERGEIDWNRGWRAGLGQPALQISNLSLSAQLRLGTMSSLSVTYDGQRRYRTYLDRSLPEELFDARFRQGVTTNLLMGRASGLRYSAGAGLRTLQGMSSDNAYFASAGIADDTLFGRHISVGLDASGYRNGFTDGLLVNAYARRRLSQGHTIDFSAGGSFYRQRADSLTHATEWGRVSFRGELGRGLYVLGDGEYDFGHDLSGPRLILEIGYRF